MQVPSATTWDFCDKERRKMFAVNNSSSRQRSVTSFSKRHSSYGSTESISRYWKKLKDWGLLQNTNLFEVTVDVYLLSADKRCEFKTSRSLPRIRVSSLHRKFKICTVMYLRVLLREGTRVKMLSFINQFFARFCLFVLVKSKTLC